MQPRVETLKTQSMNAFLLTGSNGEKSILGNGGNTTNGMQSDARDRGSRNTDSFEDLW